LPIIFVGLEQRFLHCFRCIFFGISHWWLSECQHFESRCTIYLYLDFSLKTAVFGCLTNAIAPLPIALVSC